MSAEPVHAVRALTEQLSRLPGVRTASELFAGHPPHPVDAVLQPLFRRGGLPRGEIVQVTGPHAFSLALASCAEASREQHWCAALGMGEPAVAGIADFGVDLSRFINLQTPPKDWLRVASILIEAFDILIVRPSFAPTPAERGRLAAKVRERRMSIVVLDEFPGSAERLRVDDLEWAGTARGTGRLERCTVTVRNPHTGAHVLLLPGASGQASREDAEAAPAFGPVRESASDREPESAQEPAPPVPVPLPVPSPAGRIAPEPSGWRIRGV